MVEMATELTYIYPQMFRESEGIILRLFWCGFGIVLL